MAVNFLFVCLFQWTNDHSNQARKKTAFKLEESVMNIQAEAHDHDDKPGHDQGVWEFPQEGELAGLNQVFQLLGFR
jgi:hypothetical protein